ncbi:MAG: hypothetical protein LBS55_08315 [Prevotellaceae bacterium]|jgi:hypothetical protein|nr:hypothetical protein [Prevotellaceae bacterium]
MGTKISILSEINERDGIVLESVLGGSSVQDGVVHATEGYTHHCLRHTADCRMMPVCTEPRRKATSSLDARRRRASTQGDVQP